ncbi:MAG: Cof-type HAD-IIB family hydrolase [Kiritimatiellae bacterium]|nr:Cof-type HAD-IIB family hydrolase [Kiritimatiellia bacterium]
MSEIRIIALDLDGTLLDSQKRLSAANRAALAAAADHGALIVPTTGRFFGMMPECIRELPFVRYAITVNGAQVYDRVEGRALVREEIPLAAALDVMRFLDRYDVIYDCYRNDWGWMSESFKEKAAGYATDEHYLRMIRDFRRGVPELKAHLEATASEGDVQKVMLFTRLDGARDAAQAIAAEARGAFPEIKVTSSTWNNLEFNAMSAHKGQALRRFAETMGLGLSNCMAFGDGGNDLTMIEAAGVGVAMSNACEAVRNAASYITCSNDEDGVAAALRHFGLV